jgi:N-acetylmuramoyl-L-alanine amidase
MRAIRELIWHCTATPEGREVLVGEIDRWHKDRGWSGIGYHKVVHLDGSVSEGRPESQVGAHVAGRNTGTLGYCYVGGITKDGKSKDTRTAAQKATMLRLTKEAIAKYRLKLVSGHRNYAAKDCPCFDARAEYAHLVNSK